MSRESEIIQRAAAEFIHDRHRLGAFVGGLLRDIHAAEDVLQEVWVRLAAEVEKGTGIENQPAWCRGVARNLIRRHWEKRQTAKVVADSEALEAFMDRVEQCFAWADTQEHKTHRVEPDGTGRKFTHLTWGGLWCESSREVSRGRSSADSRGNSEGAR